jgi:hypothetical protein
VGSFCRPVARSQNASTAVEIWYGKVLPTVFPPDDAEAPPPFVSADACAAPPEVPPCADACVPSPATPPAVVCAFSAPFVSAELDDDDYPGNNHATRTIAMATRISG